MVNVGLIYIIVQEVSNAKRENTMLRKVIKIIGKSVHMPIREV